MKPNDGGAVVICRLVHVGQPLKPPSQAGRPNLHKTSGFVLVEGLFEGNSKAPRVGAAERQLCLQTGLSESPVGVGAWPWPPPPPSELARISRRFLESVFALNTAAVICRCARK